MLTSSQKDVYMSNSRLSNKLAFPALHVAKMMLNLSSASGFHQGFNNYPQTIYYMLLRVVDMQLTCSSTIATKANFSFIYFN